MRGFLRYYLHALAGTVVFLLLGIFLVRSCSWRHCVCSRSSSIPCSSC